MEKDKNLKIVFMGTPEFAVASLDVMVKNNYNIVAVITAPDKAAGRGRQLQQSAVKKYAIDKGLKVLQPEKLKNEDFLNELKSLGADLQVVVAFRMLPEAVWNMPPLGTFNLHASLLPQYRGAAPINHAIINGEKETGATTFFLKHEIDTGDILFQEKVKIRPDETAGELHDKLKDIGAELVLKTVKAIEKGDFTAIQQHSIAKEEDIKHAPKIFKEDCRIDWGKTTEKNYNKIRGLSPYPTAFTELKTNNGEKIGLKIFFAEKDLSTPVSEPGTIQSDGKNYLKIACADGWLNILDLQLAGKNRMKAADLLRGFNTSAIERAL